MEIDDAVNWMKVNVYTVEWLEFQEESGKEKLPEKRKVWPMKLWVARALTGLKI